MRYTKLFFLLFLFVACTRALAQQDSIEQARQLSYQQNYKAAETLLNQFEKSHPENINSVRLHVQILYWMKHYKAALSLCEKHLCNYPNQTYLLLDYGRILFELERWGKAKSILSSYLKSDPSNIEAKNMLATIAYWQGKIKSSHQQFSAVVQAYPTNEWAWNYLSEIKKATAPYLTLNGGYNSDNQPLAAVQSGFELGAYRSYLLSPKLIFQFQNFDSGASKGNSYSTEIANKFFFSGIKSELNVSGGIVKALSGNTHNFIGAAELGHHINKNMTLSISAARKNYQYTLSNFTQSVFHTDYTASLAYFKNKSWSGKTAYSMQQFDDANTVHQFYAWLLSPAISFSKFEFYLGYNFNYASALHNRYTVNSSPEKAFEVYYLTGYIPASYNPYFTPQHQTIHALIANLSFAPSKKIKLSVNGNYGIYAKANSPYLYFDADANSQLIVARAFYKEKYSPVELNAKFDYALSSRFSLNLQYTYLKAFFFESNAAKLSLTYRFLNGKN